MIVVQWNAHRPKKGRNCCDRTQQTQTKEVYAS
jgi:hypothetical protein